MGFQDRDYTRGHGGYTDQLGSWGFNLDVVPHVVKRLVAANVIVFLLQIFFTRAPTIDDYRQYLEQNPALREALENEAASDKDEPTAATNQPQADELQFDVADMDRISIVQEWLELDTQKVLHGQVWRLLTGAFCHDRMSVWHILFNMLLLWWFGQTIELMYGSREFLLFYLTAALVASLSFVGLDLITGSRIPMIGASGAVWAVTILYTCYYPRYTIRIWFFFPVEIRWLVLLYAIFDLHPVLLALAGEQTSDGVAHAAHLGGLAFGFLYWKQQWRLEPLWDRLPQFRTRVKAWQSGLKVVRPPERGAAKDAEVDRILEKIMEQGLASLTEREKRTLDQASRRYRERDA